MQTYNIFIRETLETCREIQAENKEQALEIGRQMYKESEIVLNSNDMLGEPLIKVENQDDTLDETDYEEIFN